MSSGQAGRLCRSALSRVVTLSALALLTSQDLHAESWLQNCLRLSDLLHSRPRISQRGEVTVYLTHRLSEKDLQALLLDLQGLEAELINRPRLGAPLVIRIREGVVRSLSQLKGVDTVVQANMDGVATWRLGKRRWRSPPPSTPDSKDGDVRQMWLNMESPSRQSPWRPLSEIQELARDHGLSYVVRDRRYADPLATQAYEELYGARVYFAGDLPPDAGLIRIPGVVIHLDPNPTSLQVRGDLNLSLGVDRMYADLNKVTEHQWIQSISPSLAIESVTATDLRSQAHDALGQRIEAYVRGNLSALSARDQREIEQVAAEILEAGRTRYPDGAYFKWRDDFQTKDKGSAVTTLRSKPSIMARHFLSDLKAARLAFRKRRLANPYLAITTQERSATNVLSAWLFAPQDLLVQRALEIAKTPSGSEMEFRIDVLAGHVLNVTLRDGFDYLPLEASEARRSIEDFLAAASPRDRALSGGFDVVKLTSGQYKIIETNPGTESAWLDPFSAPIEANQASTRLLGHPTPVIQKLNEIDLMSRSELAKLLRSLPSRETMAHERFDTVAAIDVFLWLRNTRLERVRLGSKAEAQAVVDELRALLQRSGRAKDERFRIALKSAQDWVNTYPFRQS